MKETFGSQMFSDEEIKSNTTKGGMIKPSQRLPIKTNMYTKTVDMDNETWTKEQYEQMGIKIIEKFDDLFYNIVLPEGWKIRDTEHPMWNNLLDDKGRKRISFFYKGAFYDRDAFSSFEVRFHISSKQADYDKNEYEKQPEYIPSGKTETVLVNRYGNEISSKKVRMISMDGDCPQDRFSQYQKTEKPIYVKNPNYKNLTGYEKYAQPFHYEVYDFDGKVLYKSDVVKTDFEYSKENHWEFYKHLEEVECKAKNQCKEWLNANYPDYTNIHAYWND